MSFALPRLCRRLLRGLQLNGSAPSVMARAVVGIAAVPITVAYAAAVATRAALGRALRDQAMTTWGQAMECFLPDLLQSAAYLYGVWEPEVTELLQRRLRRGDVVIDVGANFGYHTLLAARQVGTEGRVVAIEASPFIFRTLATNVAKSGAAEVVALCQEAAGEATGTIEIRRGPYWHLGRSSTRALDSGAAGETEATVKMRPLAQVIAELGGAAKRLALIKIDVEGAEREVLRGLVPALAQLPERCELLIELSPQWWGSGERSLAAILAPFLQGGYTAWAVPNDYNPFRYLWPRALGRLRRLDEAALARHDRQCDLLLTRRGDVPADGAIARD